MQLRGDIEHNCFINNKEKKWFLKDNVTLKTGVIAAENSALPSQNIKNIKKTVILYFTNILQYYCFYCIFDQLDAVLVRIK